MENTGVEQSIPIINLRPLQIYNRDRLLLTPFGHQNLSTQVVAPRVQEAQLASELSPHRCCILDRSPKL